MNPWLLLRTGLHSLDPEFAHALALTSLRISPKLLDPVQIGRPTSVMGLEFPNPIGLAAGFDKNADYLSALPKLGFGFIEVGTITPKPQSGSVKPRLFRLPDSQGLINRMGLNNKGASHAARNLARANRFRGIVGINIGKNHATDNAKASADYLECMEKLYGLGDYFAINISSPNMPQLRGLQQPNSLERLLDEICSANERIASSHASRMPIAVKVAPDLDEDAIAAMAAIIAAAGIDAVIAGNTTVERLPTVMAQDYGGQPGGLSGGPLTFAARTATGLWRENLPDSVALIGCGGICCAADASAQKQAGADLMQLYTGLIYAGPALVAQSAAAWAA